MAADCQIHRDSFSKIFGLFRWWNQVENTTHPEGGGRRRDNSLGFTMRLMHGKCNRAEHQKCNFMKEIWRYDLMHPCRA
jgi:hypothetical protein